MINLSKEHTGYLLYRLGSLGPDRHSRNVPLSLKDLCIELILFKLFKIFKLKLALLKHERQEPSHY